MKYVSSWQIIAFERKFRRYYLDLLSLEESLSKELNTTLTEKEIRKRILPSLVHEILLK